MWPRSMCLGSTEQRLGAGKVPQAPCVSMSRIAIAQISMHWSTAENVAAILRAMDLARSRGAKLCAFAELAVTGFHRQMVCSPESSV